MLAVFQEVAKAVRNQTVGHLATFDLMYDGISASIRGDMQTTIKMAERQLEGLEIRILKALFLLKWVRDFKATPRNVAILLLPLTIDVGLAGGRALGVFGLARGPWSAPSFGNLLRAADGLGAREGLLHARTPAATSQLGLPG